MTGGKIHYCTKEDCCIIKMKGRLTYAMASELDSFLTYLINLSHLKELQIDLASATYLDSTVMGLLTKIGKHYIVNGNSRADLRAGSKSITEAFVNLGFHNLFDLTDSKADYTDFTDLEKMPRLKDTQEMNKVILEAHTNLVEIDENNKEEFKDVIEALSKEV